MNSGDWSLDPAFGKWAGRAEALPDRQLLLEINFVAVREQLVELVFVRSMSHAGSPRMGFRGHPPCTLDAHERDPGASRVLVSEGTRTYREPAARGVVPLETLEPGHVRGSMS